MPLTAEQKERFDAQGFLVIEDLVPGDWLRAIQDELFDLHERMFQHTPPEVGVSWEHDVDPKIQRRIKQLMHAEMISPTIN